MNKANELRTEVERAAENLQETATHLGTDASQKVAELRRTLRTNATTAKESASDSLITSAESIRTEALKSGNEELIRQSQALARSMEKAALYLDSRTVDQLGEDAKETVRENMWPTLGVVAFIAFLLGLLFGGGRRNS